MMFKADSLGFIDLPGRLPHIDSLSLMPVLNLVHLTSAPPWLTKTEDVLKAHREFVKVLEEEAYCEIICSSADLKKLLDSKNYNYKKIGVVLGLQNAPENVLENNNLKALYDEGIRIMALAYEDENVFGGGCMAPKKDLTRKGVNLLNEFTENNIILDISHAGIKTVYDIMKYMEYSFFPNFSKLSMFASHSGCYDIYMHNRNITGDMMRKIKNRGGVIGIPTLNFILSKDDNTLSAFMRHVKYTVNWYGEDNICVGSDGVYKRIEIEELKKYHEFMLSNMKYKDLWKARFPEHPIELNYIGRMSEIINKLCELYSEKVVAKICGLNFLNFLSKSLPSE